MHRDVWGLACHCRAGSAVYRPQWPLIECASTAMGSSASCKGARANPIISYRRFPVEGPLSNRRTRTQRLGLLSRSARPEVVRNPQ
jgi:hypothetical protein